MTNFEKLQAVEISGARLFEHLSLADMKYLLTNIECTDCPCYGECGKGLCEEILILDWLQQEAEE